MISRECVCVFLCSIDRSNRLTNEQTSGVAFKESFCVYFLLLPFTDFNVVSFRSSPSTLFLFLLLFRPQATSCSWPEGESGREELLKRAGGTILKNGTIRERKVRGRRGIHLVSSLQVLQNTFSLVCQGATWMQSVPGFRRPLHRQDAQPDTSRVPGGRRADSRGRLRAGLRGLLGL